jgi:hypothetical protein
MIPELPANLVLMAVLLIVPAVQLLSFEETTARLHEP